LLAILAVLGVTIVATIDAYRIAAKTKPDYPLKPYNNPVAYLLIGLMIVGSSIGYGLHIRSSLFEAFRVPAASMYPTIGVNDRLLVDKTAYRKADPQRSDIVIFHPPTGEWRYHYIKRIVALGGDTVSMRNGDLYVNGQRLSRTQVSADAEQRIAGRTPTGMVYRENNGSTPYQIFLAADTSQGHSDFEEITVAEHHCFVLGDNRCESFDSRQFGPIPYAVIEGRVDYVYWPAHTWSRFGRLD
jgi:signal peptidase I